MTNQLKKLYQKGDAISYNELLALPDDSIVWLWAKRRGRGVWMNDPIQVRRISNCKEYGKSMKCWGYTCDPVEYPIEDYPSHDANTCLLPDYELHSKKDEPIRWMDEYSNFKLFRAIAKVKKAKSKT